MNRTSLSLLALCVLSTAALAQTPPTATVNLNLTTPTLTSTTNATSISWSDNSLSNVVLTHDMPLQYTRLFSANIDRSQPGVAVYGRQTSSSGNVSLTTSGTTFSSTLSYSESVNIGKDYTVANTNSWVSGPGSGMATQGTYTTNLGRMNITAAGITRLDMPDGYADPPFGSIDGGRILSNMVSGSFGSIVGLQNCTATWHAFGLTQNEPILPSSGTAGSWTFTNVPAQTNGFWYDPPIATSFVYQATGTTQFRKINDFPTGFNSAFLVKVGATTIGSFLPGQSVDFEALLGGGVSQFTIEGINPGVDSANSNAFPLQLSFVGNSNASFTMTAQGAAIPEPGSFILIALGALPLASRLRRRRG